MPPSNANIVKIVKSCRELGLNQRVGWRCHLTCYTIRLEAVNSCCNEFNIVSPSCYYWVSLYRSARYFSCGERFFKALPGISISNLLAIFSAANASASSDECIFSNAGGISTSVCFLCPPPVITIALWTLMPCVPKFLEDIGGVELLRVCSKFRLGHILNLFGSVNHLMDFLLFFLHFLH